ncbi:hypothetical protein [Nocardia aurantia]|uniref:PASTA domain-containing protein n=1 Tax=Nocardia aurantia TaxID=2585199 RepID=A0A7K0DXT7_9NOCA|nr:hypothetical protein [Nocardia aurantia]MQY30596.1 hypothetical protein [Nocardia aurantia]
MRRPAVTVPVSVVFASVLVAGCGDSGGGSTGAGAGAPVASHVTVAASSPAAAPRAAAPASSSVAAAPDSTTGEAATSSAAAAPTAGNAAARCSSRGWPQPIPDFRGAPLATTVVGSGLCYDVTGVVTADGHDVMHDPASFTVPWTITGQAPDPGTTVSANTPVTLTVAQAPRN